MSQAFDSEDIIKRLKRLEPVQLLEILEEVMKDDNMAILLSAQWRSNEREYRNGLLAGGPYKMTQNRIRNALYETVDELSRIELEAAFKLLPSTLQNSPKAVKTNDRLVPPNKQHTISDELIDQLVRLFPTNADVQAEIAKFTRARLAFAEQKITEETFAKIELEFRSFSERWLEEGRDSVLKDSGDALMPPTVKEGEIEKIILLLSANPSKKAKLQLEKEYQRISINFEAHHSYRIRSRGQLNWQDLNAIFVQKDISDKLQILHFSGHGISGDNELEEITRGVAGLGTSIERVGLLLFDEDRLEPMVIKDEYLVDFFRVIVKRCPHLSIVIFNTCFSEALALQISRITDLYVVGIRNRVKDTAAIQFSSGFYSGVASGLDWKMAISTGCLQARPYGLENMDDVVLFHKGERLQI